MTLIIEDGAGLTDAESYVTVEEADSYHAAYGHAVWAAAETEDKESALRRAAVFLDGAYLNRFRGAPASETQRRAWPRRGIAGIATDTVPQAVRDAQSELALKALTADLVPDLERGGLIVESRIDADGVSAETRYADYAPPGTDYRIATVILAGLIEIGADWPLERGL